MPDWKQRDIIYVDQPELTMAERLYLPQVLGGMKTTLRHLFKKHLRDQTVVQYPEQRRVLRKANYRGVHRLNRDVTVPAEARKLVDSAIRSFGRLDILVNNVGIRLEASIEETTDELWHGVMTSMLDSTFLCTRAAVPHLIASGRGAIVNIGGMAGHAGIPNRAAIATAKAGIAGFTGSLAIELASKNVTVNCVSPSYIQTDAAVPAHIQRRTAPIGRHGSVGEVAATVAFLCGPGGRYITGQTIHVNGGWYVSIG